MYSPYIPSAMPTESAGSLLSVSFLTLISFLPFSRIYFPPVLLVHNVILLPVPSYLSFTLVQKHYVMYSTNWHSPDLLCFLTSSCMPFSFVCVVPKHFNFVTLSNNLLATFVL